MARFLKIRTPLRFDFNGDKENFTITQFYATDFQWSWPDAFGSRESRVNFSFYPPMHYYAHIAEGFITIQDVSPELQTWASTLRMFMACKTYDQYHEEWLYFWRDSDGTRDVPIVNGATGHSSYPVFAGWRNYPWHEYWLTDWNGYFENTSASTVGSGSMTLVAECLYAFYDDDPNYELCLADPMLEGYIEACDTPKWYLEDNFVAPSLSFRTVSAAEEHERTEPTPPALDKSVYRYQSGTGWSKEGSIYVRDNGAWTAGSGSIIVLDGWSPKDWGEIYPKAGSGVWTDGINLYYLGGIYQFAYNRDTKTWYEKTWDGWNITAYDGGGDHIWTDGNYIYYSYANKQYVLSGSTWENKTWTTFKPYYGNVIWSDGVHLYYSSGNNQYVFDSGTQEWVAKTWNGYTPQDGKYIWKDGTHIYYSQGSTAEYELDVATSTWVSKTWYGINPGAGANIWHHGETVYFSDGSNSQWKLDKDTDTWEQVSWSGFSDIRGQWVWSDGDMIYFSSGTTQYFATGHSIPGPTQAMHLHERTNGSWQDKI